MKSVPYYVPKRLSSTIHMPTFIKSFVRKLVKTSNSLKKNQILISIFLISSHERYVNKSTKYEQLQ